MAGLKDGDTVTYFAVDAIGGLNGAGGDYYVHRDGDGSVRLYDSKAKAEKGDTTGADRQIDLTSTGSGTQTFQTQVVGFPVVPHTFKADGTVFVLDACDTAQLRTGDSVVYDTSSGGTATGVTNGTTYYVIDLTNGHYQLAATRDDAYAGKAIEITNARGTPTLIDQANSSRADAQAGAKGGDIGVAGAVAVTIANLATEAVIGRTPPVDNTLSSGTRITITGNPGTTVRAAAREDELARGQPYGATDGDNAGIGASVAVLVPTHTVDATISNGVIWAATGAGGGFTVSASNAISGNVLVRGDDLAFAGGGAPQIAAEAAAPGSLPGSVGIVASTAVAPIAGATLDTGSLASIVATATQIWTQALDAGDARLRMLDQITVLVSDLPGELLGATTGRTIVLDVNAAGWGWFVDPTPLSSSEFHAGNTDGVYTAIAGGAAAGHMDLLSTVLHEMGNAMGFAEDLGNDVTGMMLDPGERRLPIASTPGHAAALAGPAIKWLAPAVITDDPTPAMPDWTDDFVNNLGQDLNARNLHAGLRIRLTSGRG